MASLFRSASPRHQMLISVAVGFFFFGSDLMVGFSSGWFLLPFSLAVPPDAYLYCCGFFFFFGSDLMGGFGSGWLFSLPFNLAEQPNVNL